MKTQSNKWVTHVASRKFETCVSRRRCIWPNWSTFVFMIAINQTNTRYGMGSTGFHAADPPRSGSDGRSGRVPLHETAPPLRKPAVLATLKPDPSWGTPGTAIRADTRQTGTAPSRLRRRSGGMVLFDKLERAQTQLYRKYLASQLLALLCVLMLRYLRLVMQVMAVSRRKLFQASALPYGVINRSIHDRRYAVFRRRAVGYLLPIPVRHVDQRETSPQSAGGIKGPPPVRTAFPVRSAGEKTNNFAMIQLKLDGKNSN